MTSLPSFFFSSSTKKKCNVLSSPIIKYLVFARKTINSCQAEEHQYKHINYFFMLVIIIILYPFNLGYFIEIITNKIQQSYTVS